MSDPPVDLWTPANKNFPPKTPSPSSYPAPHTPSSPAVKRCRPDAPAKASVLTGRECPPWSRVKISPVPIASSSTPLPLAHATTSPCALNAGLAPCRLPVTATLLNPAASNAGWGVVVVAAAALAGRFRLPATVTAAAAPSAIPPPLAAPGVVGGGDDAGWSSGLLMVLSLWLLEASGATAPSGAPPVLRVDAGGIRFVAWGA